VVCVLELKKPERFIQHDHFGIHRTERTQYSNRFLLSFRAVANHQAGNPAWMPFIMRKKKNSLKDLTPKHKAFQVNMVRRMANEKLIMCHNYGIIGLNPVLRTVCDEYIEHWAQKIRLKENLKKTPEQFEKEQGNDSEE
jgi:hypothetical protein